MKKGCKKYLMLLILLFLTGNNYAQEEKKDFNYFVYPQRVEPATFKHCLSIYAAKLPEDVVEKSFDVFGLDRARVGRG